MKTIITSIFISVATLVAVAQSPAPAPSAAPALPQPGAVGGLQPNGQVMAAVYAGQIITQVNGLITGVIQLLDNGVPAQNGQPAITAKDIQAALGPENVMKLRALAGTLSAPPAPSPTPTAKK